MFLHMARVFLFGAYKYPRELNWIIGVMLLVLGMLEGFTGYLLPWDQTRVLGDRRRDQPQRDGADHRPLPGPVPRGRAEIGADTLTQFYALHMLADPRRDLRPDRPAPVPRRSGSASPRRRGRRWRRAASGPRLRPRGGREGLIRTGRRGGAS